MRAFLAAVCVCVTMALTAAQSAYVPHRTFDSRRGSFTDFESMVAALAKADVVFIGEQHDDPNTHRLELAVLEGLARRRGDVVVSLEMFERDVQEPLDHFVMGHTEEEDFVKVSRPWPRYNTDYKPLVDFAISRHWPVIAANAPRKLASEVAKAGLEAIKSRSSEEQRWLARELRCPTDDEYYKRFAEAVADHPAPPGAPPPSEAQKRQTIERMYFAQCLKDETMGESIAQAFSAGVAAGKKPLVVHYNGAFHSDFGLGTAARARRRLPDRRALIVTMVPVADLDTLAPSKDDRKRADFLVYTLKK